MKNKPDGYFYASRRSYGVSGMELRGLMSMIPSGCSCFPISVISDDERSFNVYGFIVSEEGVFLEEGDIESISAQLLRIANGKERHPGHIYKITDKFKIYMKHQKLTVAQSRKMRREDEARKAMLDLPL